MRLVILMSAALSACTYGVGAGCDEDRDCDDFQTGDVICDTEVGRCVVGCDPAGRFRRCESNYTCVFRVPNEPVGVCRLSTGDAQFGEACSGHLDCDRGLCVSSRCTELCSSDELRCIEGTSCRMTVPQLPAGYGLCL